MNMLKAFCLFFSLRISIEISWILVQVILREIGYHLLTAYSTIVANM